MRYLLLDRITELSPAGAKGIKCVSLADDLFVDHFPGRPVMPGAMLLESMAQLSGVLLETVLREQGVDERHAVLTMADRVRFRRLVSPGDRVLLEATPVSATEDGGRATARAYVDEDLAAEAQLTFVFAEVRNAKLLAERKAYLNVWLHGSSEGEGAYKL
jgi:3-hydroxyacyl-[acyl-carrier-protein] dehydratase